MAFYLNLNAVVRHPLNREKRREFRRNPDNLLDDVARQARRELEETRLQLGVANNSLQQALARNDELEAANSWCSERNSWCSERKTLQWRNVPPLQKCSRAR